MSKEQIKNLYKKFGLIIFHTRRENAALSNFSAD
jgi:hypothetical protein